MPHEPGTIKNVSIGIARVFGLPGVGFEMKESLLENRPPRLRRNT